MRCKLSDEWEEVELREIALYVNDRLSIDACNVNSYISTVNMMENKGGVVKIDKLPKTKTVNSFKKGDILISNIRPYFKKIWYADFDGTNSSDVLVIRRKENIYDRYLYYVLSNDYFFEYTTKSAKGTKMPRGDKEAIMEYLVPNISMKEQRVIADTLLSIDDKIENNKKISGNLEEQAQVIFKHWFVDFEFPDHAGNPFKSSGGEMIESKLGMIPKEWGVDILDNIIKLHDSKRIPLSKKQRDVMDKIYPYYGATSVIDYVDDYIFDGTYLLLGEDGSVSDDLGYPILQYVWGKMWVNNHAHVITGKDNNTVEYLYMLLKNTNVNNIITGAVQKKINQRNLKSLDVIIPEDKVLLEYRKVIEPIFKKRKLIETQNQKLAQLRDTLLPKLMSREVRIPLD